MCCVNFKKILKTNINLFIFSLCYHFLQIKIFHKMDTTMQQGIEIDNPRRFLGFNIPGLTPEESLEFFKANFADVSSITSKVSLISQIGIQ